jgi:hypothetical protein
VWYRWRTHVAVGLGEFAIGDGILLLRFDLDDAESLFWRMTAVRQMRPGPPKQARLLVAAHFGAAPFTTNEFIKEQARKSDVYLGVFALRYGSEDPATGKSMTDLEYDEAFVLESQDYAIWPATNLKFSKGTLKGIPTN